VALQRSERLLDAWRDAAAEFARQPGPYVLREDRPLIDALPDSKKILAASWDELIADPRFNAPDDCRLALTLLPQPFVGDLRSARVIVLQLNPGLAPIDFHAEFVHPEFRQAVLRNLCSDFANDAYPFYFLNPRWSWTGGYVWWHKRLRGVIELVQVRLDVSRREAEQFVAQHVAALELLPYHSARRPPAMLLDPRKHLASRQLALDCIAELAADRSRVIVVVRQERAWGLEGPNICTGNDGNSRGGTLPHILDNGNLTHFGETLCRSLGLPLTR
jgi:hypothetical protein